MLIRECQLFLGQELKIEDFLIDSRYKAFIYLALID